MSEIEYREGDLVEAVKGETVIRGRLNGTGGDFWVGDSTRLFSNLCAPDWTVIVIERAKPALPTEPGLYRVSGLNSYSRGTVQLNADGEWWWVGNEYQPRPEKITAEYAAEFFMPLTPLEPVPETAARFAARLHTVVNPKIESSWYTKATAKAILKQADEIAAELGAEA